jgi:hypothetical protein
MTDAIEKTRFFLLILCSLICITSPVGAESKIIARGLDMQASLPSVANAEASAVAINSSDRHCQSSVSHATHIANTPFRRAPFGMSMASRFNQSALACAERRLTERVQ